MGALQHNTCCVWLCTHLGVVVLVGAIVGGLPGVGPGDEAQLAAGAHRRRRGEALLGRHDLGDRVACARRSARTGPC